MSSDVEFHITAFDEAESAFSSVGSEAAECFDSVESRAAEASENVETATNQIQTSFQTLSAAAGELQAGNSNFTMTVNDEASPAFATAGQNAQTMSTEVTVATAQMQESVDGAVTEIDGELAILLVVRRVESVVVEMGESQADFVKVEL